MKHLKLLLIAAVALVPSLALADSIFSPYSDDLSIQYLSMIFGNVEGTVVTGGGFDTLKVVLTSFNMAIMSLGAIVVLYSMTVSVVNTAHDGEMLGREWSSIWIPLRTAMGFALLLPVKGSTSYSVIQVFVMWIVTQGVFAADYLWENSVDSVMAGGAKPPPTGTDNAAATTLAQSIFNSLVCTKQSNIDLKSPGIRSTGPVDGKYVFGIDGYAPDYICGSVDESTSGDFSSAQNQGVVDMIDYLSSYADDFVSAYATSTTIDDSLSTSIKNAVSAAAGQYVSTLSQATAAASTNAKLSRYLEESKKQGWIMAGSSFLTLAQMSNDQASAIIDVPSSQTWDSVKQGGSDPAIFKHIPDATTFNAEMQVAESVSLPDSMNLSSPMEIDDFLHTQLRPVQDVFLSMLTSWTTMLTGQTGGSDATTQANPVIIIMDAGIWITRIITAAYVALTVAMTVLGAAAYAAGSSVFGLVGAGALWGGFLTAMNFLTAPVMILMGVLLGVGITWGFYVPLIPYLIFTMGAIGWIILVIEAMVAAPLMAIGVLHPEGKHTVFGEAHSGIMIIAGVFLRPALMIVGLIAALIMTYVVVIIISVGFLPVATSIAVDHYSLIGIIAMMVFYTMIILIGLNKAFSLIHVLPDRIMRWIGQPGEQSGADQEINELKGGAGSVEKSMSDTGSMGARGAASIQSQAPSIAASRKAKREEDAKSTGGGGPTAE